MSDATTALYESLARWQWQRRRRQAAGRAPGERGLEMRKRLTPRAADGRDEPLDGAAGLDAWLQQLLGSRPRARVLDLGCGFGISLLRWARSGSTHCLGLTTSAFQVARATEVAAAAGIGASCVFRCEPFASAPQRAFDVAIAIESLGHAFDLDTVLASVRGALRPGGAFLWVEDVLVDAAAATDPDVSSLARAWASPPLRCRDEVLDALRRAGLRVVREVDLTHRVPLATMATNRRRRHGLTLLRTLLPLPAVRRCTAAFLGGLALERLYRKRLASYRVWMSEATAGER